MKNTILFCENRNKYYQGTSNGSTNWTKNKSEAKSFTGFDAMMFISELQRMIIDAKHIKSVEMDHQIFK